MKRYGNDPMRVAYWSRVDFTESCWLWTGAKTAEGYGEIKIDRRMHYTHRWAYEFCVGPIPEGLTIDHLCRVRHCMNPDHLEVVTRKENILRGESPAAQHERAEVRGVRWRFDAVPHRGRRHRWNAWEEFDLRIVRASVSRGRLGSLVLDRCRVPAARRRQRLRRRRRGGRNGGN